MAQTPSGPLTVMAPRSAIRGAAWRFAVIAAVLFLALRPAHAYIYHLPNRVLGEHPDATGDDASADVQLAALPLSEGPMFSLADAPFGSDLPFIELTGTAMLKTGRDREPTTVVNVVRGCLRCSASAVCACDMV